MAEIQFPNSTDECVYFTNRTIGDGGKAICWVYKQDCPKCGKAKMGKPRDEKTGKAKIRAKEYVCPECGNTVEKEKYEESLEAQIDYVCPKCKNKGGLIIPFKRKSIQGVKTLRVNCEKCGENIDITKKMKVPKKKGEPDLDDD